MLLAIDIGNTNITLGVFKDDNLIHSLRLSTEITRTEDEYGILIKNLLKDCPRKFRDKERYKAKHRNAVRMIEPVCVAERNFRVATLKGEHSNGGDEPAAECDTRLNKDIKEAVISSVVVQLTEKIETAVRKYLGIDSFIISHKIKTNVVLKTDKPSEIGADRIANACAAAALYSTPAIVVDFGTATSFDIVSKNNEFIGGIIAAGMKIQAEGLSSKTSKLPKLNIEDSEHVIGRNTVDAMLSGIVRGHALMIEGLILECEKELGEKAVIIATGGYSNIIGKYLKRKFDYINPDLTLIGMNLLFKQNNI